MQISVSDSGGSFISPPLRLDKDLCVSDDHEIANFLAETTAMQKFIDLVSIMPSIRCLTVAFNVRLDCGLAFAFDEYPCEYDYRIQDEAIFERVSQGYTAKIAIDIGIFVPLRQLSTVRTFEFTVNYIREWRKGGNDLYKTISARSQVCCHN